ncbi:MAG: hypothetical protein J5829_04440 [Lachnospiraceae bacterium]|nr:hypothetical protein [Lachnospiraceae bacterium]
MITSIIVFIIMMVILFKLTGFLFKIAGKLIGAIFSFVGWLVLGVLAICATGLAFIIVPVVVIACVASIASAAALV